MRILHLSKFYPPDPGGLEHVVAALAEGAALRGHSVRVVCATGSRWMSRIESAPPSHAVPGVEVVRLPTYGVLSSQPITPGYIRASRAAADIVYLHRPHPLADLAFQLQSSRPLIVFHHADIQRQRIVGKMIRPLARAVAKKALATVVATNSHLLQARDLGPDGRKKARIIPYGVDDTVYREEPCKSRPHQFPPADAGPAGLFVGRLVAYKGLDVLLDAVLGTDLKVVIVGDGPLKQHLEERVRKHSLGQQVILTGKISETELPAFYQNADYFVFPSTTPAEMFGISLIEAMACGTPVISTSLPSGVREVNEPGKTGLEVPPHDADALRAAMETLSNNQELRQTMGQAGVRRVKERFTLDRMVEQHLLLCEELVGKK